MTGPETCYSLCHKPISTGKDELAKDPTNSSGTPISTLFIFYAFTPAPALGKIGTYTDVKL